MLSTRCNYTHVFQKAQLGLTGATVPRGQQHFLTQPSLCPAPSLPAFVTLCIIKSCFFPSLNKIIAGFSLFGEGFTAGTCFLHLLIMTLTVVSWTLYQGFGNLCRLSWHICSRIYGVIDTLVVHIETFLSQLFLLPDRWHLCHVKEINRSGIHFVPGL